MTKSTCRLRLIFLCSVAATSVAVAQDQSAFSSSSSELSSSSLLSSSSSNSAANPVDAMSCNPWKFKVLPAELSLHDRACLGLSQIASPGTLLGAAALAGVGELRGKQRSKGAESEDFGEHFAHIYARTAARTSAELLVGYLHHEDPRWHPSNEQGAFRRTKAAFLSVIDSPDQNGNARMAFAPLAGSLASGFTAMGFSQLRQTGYTGALERSGFVYSHYLAKALIREFTPELRSLAPGFIRKHF
jgi:hypothetical protein